MSTFHDNYNKSLFIINIFVNCECVNELFNCSWKTYCMIMKMIFFFIALNSSDSITETEIVWILFLNSLNSFLVIKAEKRLFYAFWSSWILVSKARCCSLVILSMSDLSRFLNINWIHICKTLNSVCRIFLNSWNSVIFLLLWIND